MFRDEANQVFHRYGFPVRNGILLAGGYLDYLVRKDNLHTTALKHSFLSCGTAVLNRIAAVRDSVTVLEVGSTLGENYHLLKQRGAFRRFREVSFTGIELHGALVELSRRIAGDDPSFQVVCAEGSDLSVFPDRCFDLVICHGVMNFLQLPERGLREMLRVARVGTVLLTAVSRTEQDLHLIDGANWDRWWIPAEGTLDGLIQSIPEMKYLELIRTPFSAVRNTAHGGTGFFMGADPDIGRKIDYSYGFFTKYPDILR